MLGGDPLAGLIDRIALLRNDRAIRSLGRGLPLRCRRRRNLMEEQIAEGSWENAGGSHHMFVYPGRRMVVPMRPASDSCSYESNVY